MMRHIRADAGLRPAIQQVAQNAFGLFSCSRILVAAREMASGRGFLWTAHDPGGDPTPSFHRSTLGRSAREAFLSPGPACWYSQRRRASTSSDRFEITYPGYRADASDPAAARVVPRALAVLQPKRSCVAVAFEFGSEWSCRLFVVDPRLQRSRPNMLRLARDLVAALSPALYNVYVAERLRTSAADSERANLARALHDGVVQSLIAAEMEVHSACRRSLEGASVGTADLRRIEELLHNEVLGLRDLMQRIKPVHIEPYELCGALSDCVGKFKADTGIACSFLANVPQISLPAAMCPPVVRIVQEALSNVRKHSGARNVQVRIEEAHGHWRLLIEDDGRGFDARVDPPTPVVIRECVRSLDGDLQVLRATSGGLRLEITFTGYVPSTQGAATRARLVAVKQRAGGSIDRASIRTHRPREGRVERRPAEAVLEADPRVQSPARGSTTTRRALVLGRFNLTNGANTRSRRVGRRVSDGKDA